MRGARHKQCADVGGERVLMAHASECNSIWCVIVPADGTRAATIRNGDFGTSPIFGQLSDKPLLASIWLCGVSDVKSNGGLRNYALI